MEQFLSKYFWLMVTVLLTTSGQLLIKIGAKRIQLKSRDHSLLQRLSNAYLISGATCILGAPLCYFMALRKVDLSVAYGFMGLTFVFVMLGSSLVIGEKLHLFHIIGTLLVFFGIVFIGR